MQLGLLAVAGLATAHMQMSYPPPFRSKHNPHATDIDYSMNGPLSKSGSDYPCKGYHKQLNTDQGRSTATWTAGQDYNVSLEGSATHNGGSCQLSLSYDSGSSWTVIHSYIGGCPLSPKLNFKLPSDTPSGDALFAWSWFNQMGDREMYMNCAHITIQGGQGAPNAQEPKAPDNGQAPKAPDNGQAPKAPDNGQAPKAPDNGQAPKAPDGQAPGAPDNGQAPGAPDNGQAPEVPDDGQAPGAPDDGQAPGNPFGPGLENPFGQAPRYPFGPRHGFPFGPRHRGAFGQRKWYARDGWASRPKIFAANVGNGCGTVEMSDVMFPNPGPNVDNISKKTAPPTGNCA